MREGFKLFIEISDKYVIVGEVENGRIVIDLVEKLKSDVILMDLYMLVMSGLEVIMEFRRINFEIFIVIFIIYNED